MPAQGKHIKVVSVVGARPQFIKAAMVSRAIAEYNSEENSLKLVEFLCHTGQHYDLNMSQVFFDRMNIPQPDVNLEVGSGPHGEMTGIMLMKIEEVLEEEKPDWVIVYGDTNSTLAGALAAAKLQIPVAHVESGLRSYNRRMPEEINRVLTDRISNLLFCPTKTSVENLEKEGITRGVIEVGDVMYDAFLAHREMAKKESTILSELELQPKKYCLATVHRQENTDDFGRLSAIFRAFTELSDADCPFVIPLHPRTQKVLQEKSIDFETDAHIWVISPVDYLEMIALESQARIILTDSGGVQKEALFAGVPCITLRDETEWVETVDAGWNHLAGADTERIIDAFGRIVKSERIRAPELYGDGRAGKKIVDCLVSELSATGRKI